MGKNILVTGASGKLGNYVSPYLKEKGYNVTNFDINLPSKGSDNEKLGIPFVRGNLISLGDCMRAIAHAQPDIIVHLGAVRFNTEIQPAYDKVCDLNIQDGIKFVQELDEDEAMRTDVMGTYYLMDAARRLKVKKIILASSYYVLGIGFRISGTSFVPQYLPIDEEHPCAPEDTYSLAKLIDEEILKAFSRAYGINSIALRLLGIYYLGVTSQSGWCRFNIEVPSAKCEKDGYMIGQCYEYVDARDVVQAIELSIKSNLKGFESFYIATDTLYSENTANIIPKRWPALKDLGKDIKGTDGIISIEKAKKILGYKPAYSWRKKI